MIRYPSFIIVFLIVFVAISLYQVKHFITQKELELAAINRKIINTQSDLNILIFLYFCYVNFSSWKFPFL